MPTRRIEVSPWEALAENMETRQSFYVGSNLDATNDLIDNLRNPHKRSAWVLVRPDPFLFHTDLPPYEDSHRETDTEYTNTVRRARSHRISYRHFYMPVTMLWLASSSETPSR